MKKEKWRKLQKDYKPDPIFIGLPEELKDPQCYEEVANKVLKAGESGHSHRYAIVWEKCKVCQAKYQERRGMVRKLGFNSYAQFLAWKKVMDVIINKREIRIPTK